MFTDFFVTQLLSRDDLRHSLCWTQYWSRLLQARRRKTATTVLVPSTVWVTDMHMYAIWMKKGFDKSPSKHGTLDDLSQIYAQQLSWNFRCSNQLYENSTKLKRCTQRFIQNLFSTIHVKAHNHNSISCHAFNLIVLESYMISSYSPLHYNQLFIQLNNIYQDVNTKPNRILIKTSFPSPR